MLVNYYLYLSWRVFSWLPVGGVWQGGVDPHLAAGTPEPVAQRLHRLGRALLPANRRGRGPPPCPRGRGLAVVAARLPRPHTRACTVLRVTATCHVSRRLTYVVRVVEAGSALGGARLAVEAAVVGVALARHAAGVHAVLPRAVRVTCSQLSYAERRSRRGHLAAILSQSNINMSL